MHKLTLFYSSTPAVILFGYIDIFSFFCIMQRMTTTNNERVKMNTKFNNQREFVELMLGECESIIAETENITFELENADNTLSSFLNELEEIRCIAEELQTLVVDYENDYFSVSSEEFDELSISLYQSIKYTLESYENDYFDTMNEELELSFKHMRDSVNEIRKTVK